MSHPSQPAPTTRHGRSPSQQAEFRRQFWQYVSSRSQRFWNRTHTVENTKRVRGYGDLLHGRQQ